MILLYKSDGSSDSLAEMVVLLSAGECIPSLLGVPTLSYYETDIGSKRTFLCGVIFDLSVKSLGSMV